VSRLTVSHDHGERYDVSIRGHSVVTDQPASGGGTDAGPTPTELFVASLASCVAFYVGRFLRRHRPLDPSFEVECDFAMSHEPPTRVTAIDLRVVLPAGVDAALRNAVERVARHCTVHNSLVVPPDVRIAIEAGALALV
jgi:putative redox protein